jgi:hypothetical protein
MNFSSRPQANNNETLQKEGLQSPVSFVIPKDAIQQDE